MHVFPEEDSPRGDISALSMRLGLWGVGVPVRLTVIVWAVGFLCRADAGVLFRLARDAEADAGVWSR